MMTILQCEEDDASFTHVTNDTHELTIFNTTALEKYLRATKTMPEWVTVSQEHAQLILDTHGVEQEHLDRLTDACLRRPIIFAKWFDGSDVLIDGNHRFVYASLKAGKDEILAWMVQPNIWRHFTIEIPAFTDLRKYLKFSTGRTFPDDVVITVRRY